MASESGLDKHTWYTIQMTLQKFFIGRTVVLAVLGGVLLLGAGFYALNTYIYTEKQAPLSSGYKNIEYGVGGVRVLLVNGVSEQEAAPGSASKITTRYFGNEALIDLNGDGREDVVSLLTQETGGSGVFYYVVAALNTEHGYKGSEGFFLGDRIAPQTTERGENGTVIVNYAERKTGESFAVPPSMGVSARLVFNPKTLQFEKAEAVR
jgi:hypothetical protein